MGANVGIGLLSGFFFFFFLFFFFKQKTAYEIMPSLVGSEPNFTAIRIFDNPEGWIARFTGDDIASAYPRLA